MNSKKRNRGILSSFLCCFGNKNNNSATVYQPSNQPEVNGNPRGNGFVSIFYISFQSGTVLTLCVEMLSNST